MYGQMKRGWDELEAVKKTADEYNELVRNERVTNGNDEAVFTFDEVGRITEVWLEPGVTERYDHETLTDHINDSLADLRQPLLDNAQWLEEQLADLLAANWAKIDRTDTTG
ncbi:hypothetical protein P0W64_16605 [Tsukamurella sp. 8F]|uniref:hypothetical protein n=1 Tax=unclassified Tsukamurella TaxID=2633480 RepID=UPI0023BA0545|nr:MULTISPECIES: hypothetical protein [unclassified Tsukamurella]MDF0531157.1 hypothetical protein [Tsukamurella sp. 8J]MDF0588403.1 hypothetical protein [Tsukamurella sp. 8F]